MAHGPVIVGNGGGSTVLPHKVWNHDSTGGLTNKSPYQANKVERDNCRGIPAELHDEIMATKAFKKRRVETVKSTSEAFKRAMFKEADQEADAVVSAAARMGVGYQREYEQYDLGRAGTTQVIPERWSQKLIAEFHKRLEEEGRAYATTYG